MSWLLRLRQGLKKTQQNWVARLGEVLLPGRAIDDQLLDQLEEVLVSADVGMHATQEILGEIRARAGERGLRAAVEIWAVLKELLTARLAAMQAPLRIRSDDDLTVFLILGVNGSGKTTTIGKLAAHLAETGTPKKVVFAAADTFRAAAAEQLAVWAERVGATLICHQAGADPSAVAYDAVDHALKTGAQLLFIDTAGRLHTKHNLMAELKKVDRVVTNKLAREVDERLLVIDATNGQNAIQQAQIFHQTIPLTGLVLTKLDGTAKGGAIVAIAMELGIPVKLIGVGEQLPDLHEFQATEFVRALFEPT